MPTSPGNLSGDVFCAGNQPRGPGSSNRRLDRGKRDLTLFTGTSKLVKRWYLYFFLDKRYSYFGMS